MKCGFEKIRKMELGTFTWYHPRLRCIWWCWLQKILAKALGPRLEIFFGTHVWGLWHSLSPAVCGRQEVFPAMHGLRHFLVLVCNEEKTRTPQTFDASPSV